MMTRFVIEELIIKPKSIRGNNFIELGTIIQFHKTTTLITAHDAYIHQLHNKGEYHQQPFEHDKVITTTST